MNDVLRITLLRHAHALPATPGQADAERALSPQGEAEADGAADWLAQRPKPKRVLCSPAIRTQQTLSRVMARYGFIDTRTEPSIYEASPGDLFELIERHQDAGHLLLVGHNPGFESLVALLSTGQSGDYRGMPPAGIAELEIPLGNALEPGAAKLTAFWWP